MGMRIKFVTLYGLKHKTAICKHYFVFITLKSVVQDVTRILSVNFIFKVHLETA